MLDVLKEIDNKINADRNLRFAFWTGWLLIKYSYDFNEETKIYKYTKYYNYNNTNRETLIKILTHGHNVKVWEVSGIGTAFIYTVEPKNFKDTYQLLIGKSRRQGAMLMFTVPDAPKEYEKYGIYNNFDKNNYNDNCLTKLLMLNNVDEKTLNNVKVLTKGRLYIP